jgi:hypothetical protein
MKRKKRDRQEMKDTGKSPVVPFCKGDKKRGETKTATSRIAVDWKGDMFAYDKHTVDLSSGGVPYRNICEQRR